MKKLLLGVFAFGLSLSSCMQPEPVLDKNKYTVVDTIGVSRNGFNHILGYRVLVKINKTGNIHYGYITDDKILTEIEVLPLDLEKLK
jgi:hypothetical protein